jgi:hypothetical protein
MWFYPGYSDSTTNKTDHHDITEIFLYVGITYSCRPDAIIGTSSLRLKTDDIFCKSQGKDVSSRNPSYI